MSGSRAKAARRKAAKADRERQRESEQSFMVPPREQDLLEGEVMTASGLVVSEGLAELMGAEVVATGKQEKLRRVFGKQ